MASLSLSRSVPAPMYAYPSGGTSDPHQYATTASQPSGSVDRTRDIDASRWAEELDRVDITKRQDEFNKQCGNLSYSFDLNALVLDYLLIEGFSDAALEFARETGLALDVDQAVIQERMEIRDAVEDGRVEEAVRRVNELDPEILDTNAPLLFHLHLLRLIEFIRAEQIDLALDFATRELAPRGAQNPEFLSELERTMALLAFPDLARLADDIRPLAADSTAPAPDSAAVDLLTDPAFLPIGELMTRRQRVKVAKELNAAILTSQGQSKETKLMGLVRLMSWGEERLEKAGVGLPEGERDRGRKWVEQVLESA